MRQFRMTTTVTLTEKMLGTMSGNPELHHEFVVEKVLKDKGDDLSSEEQAGRMKEEDEVQKQTIEHYKQKAKELNPDSDPEQSIEKSMTMFARDGTGLFLYDYQIRGFYKEALKALIEMREVKSCSVWTVNRGVDCHVFVFPRRVYLIGPDDQPIKDTDDVLQRPLRAQTMRGERIALAASRTVPEGTRLTWETKIFDTPAKVKAPKYEDILLALDYGEYKGLGQWRGGGWGRFKHVTTLLEKPKSRAQEDDEPKDE